MSVRFGTLSRIAVLKAKQARCAMVTHLELSRFLAASTSDLITTPDIQLIDTNPLHERFVFAGTRLNAP
jgi:hypothetical protein